MLVQTGDMVDSGVGSRRLMAQLMRLQREAPRAGGQVVVLTGNHEAMNVTGDLRHVDPGEYAAFGSSSTSTGAIGRSTPYSSTSGSPGNGGQSISGSSS